MLTCNSSDVQGGCGAQDYWILDRAQLDYFSINIYPSAQLVGLEPKAFVGFFTISFKLIN